MELTSLNQSANEARAILRDRLSSFLHGREDVPRLSERNISDEDLLELLNSVEITSNSGVEEVERSFNKIKKSLRKNLNFKSIISSGWFRLREGKLEVLDSSTRRHMEDTVEKEIVNILSASISRKNIKFIKRSRKILPFIKKVLSAESELNNLSSDSPSWVALRLWDRNVDSCNSDFIKWWVDRWKVLSFPKVIPSRDWSEEPAITFYEQSIDVIKKSYFTWEGFLDHVEKLEVLIPRLKSEKPSINSSLLDRYIWLTSRALEPVSMSFFLRNPYWGLIKIILDDVEYKVHPHSVMPSIIDLSVDHPEVLWSVVDNLKSKPNLLADFLLDPRTTALACKIISDWNIYSNTWEREAVEADLWVMKSKIIDDSISVLKFYLLSGKLPLSEFASWMLLVLDQGRSEFDGQRNLNLYPLMLGYLQKILSECSAELLEKIYLIILNSKLTHEIGTSSFSSVILILMSMKKVFPDDSKQLIKNYIESLNDIERFKFSKSPTPQESLLLVRLANHFSDITSDFLQPIDIKRTFETTTDESKRFAIASTIAEAIRIHISVIAYAISLWEEYPSESLIGALISNIKLGAYDDDFKGKVAAYGPEFDYKINEISRDRQVVYAISDALKVLNDSDQLRVVRALIITDEPYFLAQLYRRVPVKCKELIRNRLDVLEPDEAADIWSLSEVQARINEFLNAGLTDLADSYIKAEMSLKTWGSVPNRSVETLNAQLRLALLKKDWRYIAEIKSLPNLSSSERVLSGKSILFFRAIAELQKPEGNIEFSITSFQELHDQDKNNNAYLQNLHAAKIAKQVNGNIFKIFNEEETVNALKILHEIEISEKKNGYISAASKSNKALLLLMLDRPEECLKELKLIAREESSDMKISLMALAYFRLGNIERSDELINDAEQTEVIEAVSNHIKNGKKSFNSVVLNTDNSELGDIEQSLFKLLSMGPTKQAKILYPEGDLPRYILQAVRNSAAGITALVPMMKNITLDGVEDDLNSLLREILTANFSFIKWNVDDQSKGGYTEKGNPGERDIIIKVGNSTLAVIEALKCHRPASTIFTKEDLAYHFKKLLGYSECSIFIHITYSYLDNGVHDVLNELKKIAMEGVAKVTFKGMDDLSDEGTLPKGLHARFIRDQQHIDVFYLVLDIKQNSLCHIVRAAGKRNPRKSNKDRNDAS